MPEQIIGIGKEKIMIVAAVEIGLHLMRAVEVARVGDGQCPALHALTIAQAEVRRVWGRWRDKSRQRMHGPTGTRIRPWHARVFLDGVALLSGIVARPCAIPFILGIGQCRRARVYQKNVRKYTVLPFHSRKDTHLSRIIQIKPPISKFFHISHLKGLSPVNYY